MDCSVWRAPPGASGLPIQGERLTVIHCVWVLDAYTGLDGDVPPPAGWGGPPDLRQGSYAPGGLPADPQPALFPGRATNPTTPIARS